MGKGKWPSKSKGVFYSGYNNAQNMGSINERDPEHETVNAFNAGRSGERIHERKSGDTVQSMRVPHPRKTK